MSETKTKKLNALVATFRTEGGEVLYISNQVAPDLLIRTTGEVRISVDELKEIISALDRATTGKKK